jgi:hypothetical protein
LEVVFLPLQGYLYTLPQLGGVPALLRVGLALPFEVLHQGSLRRWLVVAVPAVIPCVYLLIGIDVVVRLYRQG